MWVFIEYSMVNILLYSLPNTEMKCIVFKNIAKKSFHQKTGGNQRFNVEHSISQYNYILMSHIKHAIYIKLTQIYY